MHLDAFARRSGDYRIPGGVQANSSVSAEGGAVGGSTFFNGGFFGLALTNTRSLYHIPGTESAANNTRIDLEQTKLLGKGEFRPDSAVVDAVRLWFGATDYRHFEKSIGEDGIDGTQATFRNREQEARVETQLQPVDHAVRRLDRRARHPVQSSEPRHRRRGRLADRAERNHRRRILPVQRAARFADAEAAGGGPRRSRACRRHGRDLSGRSRRPERRADRVRREARFHAA